MSTESHPPSTESDLEMLEDTLAQADPADAPETANTIADTLGDLLDETGAEPLDEDKP